MAGETFDLHDDNATLSINSPKNLLGGPYAVIHKDVEERWAIVAMEWDGAPHLGMRWFWGNMGNPLSRRHPTWLVVPTPLNAGILSSLGLNPSALSAIFKFLNRELSGEELKRVLSDLR